MKRLRLRIIVCLSLLAIASGCNVIDEIRRPRVDMAAGMFEKATITYDLDASRLGEPMALARVEGQTVSYDPQPSAPEPGTAVAKLKIVYPHPDGLAGYAQAEVIIESKLSKAMLKAAAKQAGATIPKWKVAGLKEDEIDYEIWRFDLPKTELDRAVGSLTETGFFSKTPDNDAGVDLDARLDNVHRHRGWKQVPGLDAVMLRVRRSGQLVTYRRAPAVATAPRANSVDAYRALVGTGGQTGRTPPVGPAAMMAAMAGQTQPFSGQQMQAQQMQAQQMQAQQMQAQFPGRQLPSQYPGQPQYPGQYAGQQAQYPGQYPGQQPQLPGQYPAQQPQYPGQYPAQQAQYPAQQAQYPAQQAQYPAQQAQLPGQYPVQQPQYPGQYPGQQVQAQFPGQPPAQAVPGQFPAQMQPGQYPGQIPAQPAPVASGVLLSAPTAWPGSPTVAPLAH